MSDENRYQHLENRIAYLKRVERDLVERRTKQIKTVEAAGHWVKSNPLYQRLSSALSRVQGEMAHEQNSLDGRKRSPLE